MKITKLKYAGLAVLLLAANTAHPANSGPHLSLREKRAACAVAFYHAFYRHKHHLEDARESRKKGELPTPTFLYAEDASGNEVTPDALFPALRRKGYYVFPAWTEKKWWRKHRKQSDGTSNSLSLRKFKLLDRGRIRWEVDDYLQSSDSEPSATVSTIELEKKNRVWRVTKWHTEWAAN